METAFQVSPELNEEERNEAIAFASSELLAQDLARQKINAFIEYTYKDESGRQVTQAAIHKEIQWHIDECLRRDLQNCGVLAPWGHGKTEQVLARVLDAIGKNRNIRTQIICNADENATARVGAVKRYIEEDEEYQAVYPGIVPAKDDWGKHKITIQRDSKAKDGTLESWGITSAGTGSRADLQIFDDPVDLRNAILNPALREQVKQSFYNVWMSRLVPTGYRVYIATVWHEDDLTNELLRNKEWNFLVMRISEDFSCIECESCFKGKYTIPLWSVWNERLLRKRHAEIGSRAFDRGYRQEALNDEDRTFPSSDSIFDYNVSRDVILPHWPRITGIDPFGQAVVIFTIALSMERRKFVLDIRRGKWEPKRTVDEILDVWQVHRPQVIVVENNASQEAIVQWLREKGGWDLPILPFTTGKQKADPMLGLPSIEVEFSNRSWVCPMQGIDPTDSDNPYNVWKKELRNHPIGAAADTVMASWFAREGARLLTEWKPETPDTITGEDMGVEEVEIGSY